MVLDTGNILLIGSTLLLVSILASKVSSRMGIPALVLFLGVGMLFGSDGVGITFDNPGIAQFIGMVALSIILFSGGMDTKFSEIRPVLGPGVTMATLGIVINILIVGGCVYGLTLIFHRFIQLSLTECLLLGAITASTDSASVFSILRSRKGELRHRLRPLLELESGSNDPMAYIFIIVLIDVMTTGHFNLWHSVGLFLMQMVIGACSGYLLGLLAVRFINGINLTNKSLYAVLLLSWVFIIFSMTDFIHGNGYLAVYIAGLVVGSKKIAQKNALTSFFDGFTWLFQVVVFLTLGLLVNPSELLHVMGIGSLIAVVIILSRPVMVFICMLPWPKFPKKARFYVSWVGLRGAVPIIFATYPMIAGIEHANVFFNIVFCITLISLLVQGSTVGWFADLLGLFDEPKDKNAFDVTLPEKIKSALSEIEVDEQMLSHGNRLRRLPLPEHTVVVMVFQKGRYFVPKPGTVLHPGDKLLIISDNDQQLRDEYLGKGLMKPLGRPQ
ncbi:K+/H+ antiporter [Bacteroidia bacterium]|nr:K+/H+ antiporter [Bacteroidia bacterium]